MFVRTFQQSLTLSTVGVANSCSTNLNGLLYSVRVFFDWNPAAAHNIATFRSLSTGSTKGGNILFRVSGTTVSSSETWYEFFPRKLAQQSTLGSSGLTALIPVDGYLHTRITTSSGFAGKVGSVVYSVI